MRNMNRLVLFITIISCYYLTKLNIEAAQLPTQSSPSPKNLNELCTRDRQCIEHAYCRGQKMCVCDEYYFPGKNKSTCHAASGLPCESNDTCNTMANAECGTEKKCVCKKDYLLDHTNSSNCFMKPARNGDFCQETMECVERLGSAICFDHKCKCLGSHFFVNETGKCILARGLHQECQHDYECYDEKISKTLQCINRECAIAEKNTGLPDEGSSLTSSLLTIGLSLVLSIFLLDFKHIF